MVYKALLEIFDIVYRLAKERGTLAWIVDLQLFEYFFDGVQAPRSVFNLLAKNAWLFAGFSGVRVDLSFINKFLFGFVLLFF